MTFGSTTVKRRTPTAAPWLNGTAFLSLLGAACLCVWPTRVARADSITMQAEAQSTRLGEPFRVEIRAESDTGERIGDVQLPRLSGFEVLSRQVSRPMQFQFGFGGQTFRSSVIYRLTLRATRAGTLRIGPAKVRIGSKRYSTKGIDVTVSGTAPPQTGSLPPSGGLGAGSTSQGGRSVFLRTVVSPERPYVQQQTTVTVYLYTEQELRASPVVTKEPSSDGFWVQDLLPPTRTLRASPQVVDGVRYWVYPIRRFAAFPLKSGELSIGPVKMKVEAGSVFDLLRGNAGAEVVASEAQSVSVRNLPKVPASIDSKSIASGSKDKDPVVVGEYTLRVEVEGLEGPGSTHGQGAADPKRTAKTGEALTVRATIEGFGNLNQLRLELPGLPGLRILDPQVSDRIEKPHDRIGGTRTFEWLVIPEKPGTYELPTLSLLTFNPISEDYKRVTATPEAFEAKGAATNNTGDNATTSRDAAGSGWPPPRDIQDTSPLSEPSTALVGLGAALPPFALLTLLVVMWLGGRARNTTVKAPRGGHLREAERALEAGDLRACFRAVSEVLDAAIKARTGASARALTETALRQALSQEDVAPDTIAKVVDLTELVSYYRFAQAEDGEAAEKAAKAIRMVAHLKKELSP